MLSWPLRDMVLLPDRVGRESMRGGPACFRGPTSRKGDHALAGRESMAPERDEPLARHSNRPPLAIFIVDILIRLRVVREAQARAVPLQLFASQANGDVAQQDGLGQHRREIE